MADERSPEVVEGPIIRTDRSMVILYAVGSGLLGTAAGFVLWDTWSHNEGEYVLPFHLAKDSLFTSFVVGLCLLGGTGCTIVFVFQFLFPQQLIFGKVVLQLTESRISGQSVALQIPYSNIKSVTCQQEEHGFQQLVVGIDLHRPDAPGMYAPGYDFGNKEPNDRDVCLPGFFTVGAKEIARHIADRCRLISS